MKFIEFLEFMFYLDICYIIFQFEVFIGNNIIFFLMVFFWYNKEIVENDVVEDFEKSSLEIMNLVIIEYLFFFCLLKGVFERIFVYL